MTIYLDDHGIAHSTMRFDRYTFGSDPNSAFADGAILAGFDADAVGSAAYRPNGPVAVALFDQYGVNLPEDDELAIGLLRDGRTAVIGLTVEGHPFWVERARELDAAALGR